MKNNVGGIDKILRIGAGRPDRLGRRRRPGLGLDRRDAAGHRPARHLPGLLAAGHQQLPAEEGLSQERRAARSRPGPPSGGAGFFTDFHDKSLQFLQTFV
jgi:hypothetical protein